MKKYQSPVVTNVYQIPERLREIDPEYFVVRNHRKQTFEIHHRGQSVSTYCLTVPYPELDCRTLELVRKTSVSRMDTLIRQMDEHNRKIEEARSAVSAEAHLKTREVLAYVNAHESKEWVDENAYSTRFL